MGRQRKCKENGESGFLLGKGANPCNKPTEMAWIQFLQGCLVCDSIRQQISSFYYLVYVGGFPLSSSIAIKLVLLHLPY